MMDLSTLEHVNRQAARRSAAEKKVPLIIEQRDLDAAKRGDLSGVEIPFIGDRTPRGWRRVNIAEWFDHYQRGIYPDAFGYGAFFVDKSGFRVRWRAKSALTLGEFLELIKPGFAYGVVEEGQFQVHVGVFQRTG